MLILSRKLEEGINIDNRITIKILEIKRNMVRIGLDFPEGCTVLRQEVFDRMKKENMAASAAFDETISID